MTSITEFMTADHRSCDDRLAAAESAAQREQWPAATTAWRQFEGDMRRHLGREEDLLFPAFDAATGHRGGPTMMMRMEHDQMRGLMTSIAAAIGAHDRKRCLDLVDTLVMLIQQHNMKEEQILYPMCDSALPDAAAMCARLAAHAVGAG